MKLPRIVANQNIPSQIPGGYAGGEAFGVGAAGALAEGSQQVGRSAMRATDAFAHAEQVLRVADARAEYDSTISRVKQEFADRDIALRQQGVDPDQYPKQLGEALKDITEKYSAGMKYPESQALLKRGIDQFGAEKLTAAKYDAQTMKDGLVNVREGILQQEDANTAVAGATAEERQAAFGRGMDRGGRGLLERRYTASQAEAMTTGFLARVEEGQMYKDAANPEMRPAVLATLLSNGYKHMTPEKQRTIAHTMQDQSDKQHKDLQEGLSKWWGEQQQLKVADLFRQAAKGTLTVDQLNADSVDWRLHRTDIAALQTEMGKPLVEPPSDPATLDRLDISVHSQHPSATEREINADRAAGRLNRKDALAFKDKLVAAKDRIENKSDSIDTHRFNQAKDMMRAAYNIPAAADKYEGAQGKVWAAGLRELTSRSKGSGGTEDAMKVAADIIPAGRAALGEDVQLEIDKLKTLLGPYQTLPALKAALASGVIKQGEHDSKATLMIDLNDAMARQQKVDEKAAKEAAERAEKDREKKSGLLPAWLKSPFGVPPANLPAKDMGRPK